MAIGTLYTEEESNIEGHEALQLPSPLKFPASRARTCARRRVPIKDRISAFTCIVACLGALWFLAAESARIDVMNQTVVRLSVQLQRINASNEAFAAKVATLVTPDRILLVKDQYHMRYGSPIHIPNR